MLAICASSLDEAVENKARVTKNHKIDTKLFSIVNLRGLTDYNVVLIIFALLGGLSGRRKIGNVPVILVCGW